MPPRLPSLATNPPPIHAVTSVIALTRAFMPGLVARNAGHLITMGSVAGQEAYGGGSVYCATKFALDAFTKAGERGGEGRAGCDLVWSREIDRERASTLFMGLTAPLRFPAFANCAAPAVRHDVVGTDVRVTSISPGAVKTEFRCALSGAVWG